MTRPSDPAANGGAPIAIELALVDGDRVRRERLEMRAGATVGEAMAAFVARGCVGAEDAARLPVAVFGRVRAPGYVLHEGDRLELLGPLLADPKVARRARVEQRRAEKGKDKWRAPGVTAPRRRP